MDIQAILGAYAAYITFPVVLIAAVVAGVLAFFGYTLFKKCLSLSGAVAFGIIGSSIVAPYIPVALPIVNLPAVVGIVCAIIGAILITKAYKLALFVMGAGAGFYAGYFIVAPMFALDGVIAIVVGAVLAIIVALLALRIFKGIFILLTSVVSLAGIGALASLVIFQQTNIIFVAALAVVGLIVGIFGAKKQFTDNAGMA